MSYMFIILIWLTTQNNPICPIKSSSQSLNKIFKKNHNSWTIKFQIKLWIKRNTKKKQGNYLNRFVRVWIRCRGSTKSGHWSWHNKRLKSIRNWNEQIQRTVKMKNWEMTKGNNVPVKTKWTVTKEAKRNSI